MLAWMGEGSLSYRSGALLLAGSGVVLSFTAVAFRGVDEASDWQFLAVRGGSAAAAMLLLSAFRSRTRPVPWRDAGWRIVPAAGLLTTMSIMFILALSQTTTATVTLLIAAGPLSGAFFGRVFLGERLDPRTVVAMVTAGGGIAVMASDGLDRSSSGFLLAAVIPLLLGMYNMLLRSMPATDPVVPAFLSTAALMVISGTVALADTGLAMPWRDVALGVLCGFVLMGIGVPMMNLGHRAVPTARISLLMMTELVLAPLWVWIWPGERPGATTLVGGGIVVAAVVGQVLGSTGAGVAPDPSATPA